MPYSLTKRTLLYSYTSGLALYIGLYRLLSLLPIAMYRYFEEPLLAVHELYDPEHPHANKTEHVRLSGVIGIFVHPVYDPVQLRQGGCSITVF